MLKPLVEELSEDYRGKVVFVRINTDENPDTAVKYSIRSIPTVLIFRQGEVVIQIVGFRPKSDFTERLDRVLE